MELVKPTIGYKESYLTSIDEERAETDRHVEMNHELARNDFSAFVESLKSRAEGKGLPEGYVPDSIFWLVDKGEYIGRVSIRHVLTENLLKYGGHIGYTIRPSKRRRGYGSVILQLILPKAVELGIKKVLVTCDETNEGSRRIIEKAGGVLENKETTKEGIVKLRYWISV